MKDLISFKGRNCLIYNTRMFIDEADIHVESGRGGDGMVHFRREKYVNRGGPDGGDGGKGGNVIIRTNPHLNTLENFRHQSDFHAENGKPGGPKNQTGKSGSDLIIDVPPGTIVYDASSGNKIIDLVGPEEEVVICKGGRGGRGNSRFASSRIQAPRLAEKGEPGSEKDLHLELKLIADVGIIGMPNAGKSSFLAAVSNAKPKIANYPFTTLVPNLGVVEMSSENVLVLADIPGLIEGAHTGLGLGDTFLKHVQRTRVLIHLLDGTSQDPVADYHQINTEIALYDPLLAEKPQVVAVNKIDMPDVTEKKEKFKKAFDEIGAELFFVSALARKNLDKVLWKCVSLLEQAESEEPQELAELPVYRPASAEKQYRIVRIEDGWIIRSPSLERAAAMTYWESFASIRRFHKILEATGIANALREKGINEGDSVFIGNHELTWIEEWEGA